MKKTLVALSIVGLLSACSSNEKATLAPLAECAFPDAPTVEAPLWVCSAPIEGVEVSAVGSAQVGAAGMSFAKQQGATQARVELAQMMKVQVNNMIKQYVETTGAGDTETVDQVLTSVTKQLTSESLVGTRIFRTMTSPNKTLYVLVGLDAEAAANVAKVALKTSMNNDQAIWQKIQANKGQDEMAAEIAKMKAGE